ncbi:MAG TPA: RNA-binding S4 domain-containing protein [Chitinophagales bacterium]|nr:RNA-binding S4 domain-containing protein [Chitinophagales bacterium]HQO32548.1 RNA-binding S4 domain-containing protein [Chitinophagales bacterium]
MDTFKLRKETILLNQLLKALGWCESGAQANAAIEQGLVQVNGQQETRKRCQLHKGCIISFGKEQILLD